MDDNELDELKEIFLEECRENVDILEQGLLQLGQGDNDVELLNEVFRAAHSIKGGGATFGFAALAELTHHMETLLDEMRAGKRDVSEDDLELLLESVDIVRDLMESRGNEDHDERLPMQTRLEESVANTGGSAPANPSGEANAEANSTTPESTEGPEASSQKTFEISFQPKPELLVRGNDPLLLVRELIRLGELELTLDASSLPAWEDCNSKSAYLSWTARLTSDCTVDDVTEIFEWIEFDCDVKVTETALPEGASDRNASLNPGADDTKEQSEATTEPAQAGSTAQASGGDKATPAKKPRAKSDKQSAPAESSSIRISTDKIDQLINLVGELVITQSMLNRLGADDEPIDVEALRDRLADLDRNTRELQESVMRVRMLPLSSGFNRLPRLVRDLSRKLDKKVDLVVEGGNTEIDKNVLERMMDPLVHLVRNSLDHGLETVAERVAAGKSETGELRLNAYHQSGSVVIEIADDGKGINRDVVLSKARERGVVGEDETLTDEQVYKLLFAPGFSTAQEVSDVSGRGVGMDVVRRNIVDLGGHVDIHSEHGKGTTVVIRLPLTLAILDGQLVSVCGNTFVIPLLSIVETIEMRHSKAMRLPNGAEVFEFREEYVPLINLATRLDIDQNHKGSLIVIIETHGHLTGLVIDQVLGQQQAVIKTLDDNYRSVTGIAGATIMSDGSVALILDPAAYIPSARPFATVGEPQAA